MKFYSGITKLYDYIFPLHDAQVDFVERELRNAESGRRPTRPGSSRILDVGCGTGNLSLALAGRGYTVTGIDVDEEMVARAEKKARGHVSPRAPGRARPPGEKRPGPDVRFLRMDMMKIGNEFGPKAFDAILCFGNTLVHLTDPAAVRGFLAEASRVLVPGGLLLLQIINYDRILDHNIQGLTTIENEHVRFKRNYSLDPDTGLLLFHTILTAKGTGEIIENTIPLFPLRERQLHTFLEETGFGGIEMFGSFSGASFSLESVPLIVSARLS